MSTSQTDLKTPVIMFLFQLCILFCMFIASKSLRKLSSASTLSYIFFNLFSFLIYFLTSQSSPGYITLQDLPIQKKSSTIKACAERSVSFEVEIIQNNEKKASTPSLQTKSKDIKAPSLTYDRSPQAVNTNRSEHEEEKENTQNHIENSNIDDIQIVEIRHCTVCKIDQPIRTKHCRDCGRCVATQDHHCPWLGICVGEKNKKSFYLYLVVQMTQILWTLAIVTCIQDLNSIKNADGVLDWIKFNWLNVFIATGLGPLLLMVSGLIGFHLYLASVNLTTREFLSWNKIPYLKGLDKKLGSPFSNGLIMNLYGNCCRRIPKYFIVWEISR